MKEKIIKALNKQINTELYSAYLYMAMSANFESMNLKGFANWMKVQSQEEITHAMKFYDYVNERGNRVVLDVIEKPPIEWKTPLKAFEAAYEHEQKVTGMINNLVELTAKEKDHAISSMLQWFIDEQVEEEASADRIVQKLKAIGDSANALFMLDIELGKRTFK